MTAGLEHHIHRRGRSGLWRRLAMPLTMISGRTSVWPQFRLVGYQGRAERGRWEDFVCVVWKGRKVSDFWLSVGFAQPFDGPRIFLCDIASVPFAAITPFLAARYLGNGTTSYSQMSIDQISVHFQVLHSRMESKISLSCRNPS